MVVLSAAICNKAGKAVLARQFVPMSRLRIEGLLAAFPKLLESESEHTFVETENVRYVYQPLEELFLLVVTNKQSNIMEDLDTLRLLAKLIPEYCSGQTEEDISESAYELVFAFDEVVALGYKESVTLDQIRKYTEMDSHEEKLQKIIMESKESEARDEMRRKALSIDKQKQEMKRLQGGLGPSDYGHGGGGGGGGYGGGSDDYDYEGQSGGGGKKFSAKSYDKPMKKKAPTKRKAGMTFGKKIKEETFFDEIAKEAKEQLPANLQISHGHLAQQAAGASMPPEEAIIIKIQEKLLVELERDGGLNQMDVRGVCDLTVMDPDYARLEIHTSGISKASSFITRTHPKFKKSAWTNNGIMALKDPSKPVPVGQANSLPILKWRMQTQDESMTPISFNTWPSEENGMSVMSVEYQMENESLTLQDVVVSIPCPGIEEQPEVSQCDGDTTFDRNDYVLNWHIEQIKPGDSGSLEFQCDEIDSDDFYPLEVSFHTEDTLSGLTVTDVVDVDSGDSYERSVEYGLIADKYVVE